jgi:hypothetical protein
MYERLAEYMDPEQDPMIPHVIVLEPDLVIFKIYNGEPPPQPRVVTKSTATRIVAMHLVSSVI